MGYVTLGTLFTSLGLSLVIYKMGLMTCVPSGPGLVVKTERGDRPEITCSSRPGAWSGRMGTILVHQPRKIQLILTLHKSQQTLPSLIPVTQSCQPAQLLPLH